MYRYNCTLSHQTNFINPPLHTLHSIHKFCYYSKKRLIGQIPYRYRPNEPRAFCSLFVLALGELTEEVRVDAGVLLHAVEGYKIHRVTLGVNETVRTDGFQPNGREAVVHK